MHGAEPASQWTEELSESPYDSVFRTERRRALPSEVPPRTSNPGHLLTRRPTIRVTAEMTDVMDYDHRFRGPQRVR